ARPARGVLLRRLRRRVDGRSNGMKQAMLSGMGGHPSRYFRLGQDLNAKIRAVIDGLNGRVRLIWPHCDGLIWPHPTAAAFRSVVV
ncbi:MAG: hypothetical protein ACR2J0_09790, partial [Mycobacteriales bacterium]